MSKARPHWAVYVLASVMALAFFSCTGLVLLSDEAERERETWRWGFVDRTGTVAIPVELDAARGFSDGRAAARQGGLWGFIDHSGAFVVPPRFAQLCDFKTGQLTCAQDDSGSWGYIDDAGEWALPAKWAIGRPMRDGVAAIGEVVGTTSSRIGTNHRVHHFGLIDRSGAVVVPIAKKGEEGAWTIVGGWGDGRMPVQVDGVFGYVDTTGQFLIPPTYQAVQPFRGGFAAVSKLGGWGVIDLAGSQIVKETNGLADGASDGLIAGPKGYTDLEGTPVGERYEWVRPHSDGLGAVLDDKLWGFVDLAGAEVIARQWPRVSDFSEGRAVAAQPAGLNYKWGIIDRDGAWVVEPRWEGVDSTGFHEGLLAVGIPPAK